MITGKRKAISNFLREFFTRIDAEKRAYKLEERLFGIFRWGSFRPLPKLDYVLVFRSLFAKCEACSFEDGDDNPSAYFQVSLVHHSNRRIIVHETRLRNEAFELAGELARKLDVRLMDSATNPRKGNWINPEKCRT